MAFFPMTQFDFPNATYFDSNLREFLYKLRELIKMYNQMGNEFEEIKNQFEEFKQVIDSLPAYIKNEISAQIEPEIARIDSWLNAEIVRIDSDTARLSAQIVELSERMSDVISAWVAGDNALREEFDVKLGNLERELNASIANIQNDINNLQFKLPEIYNIAKGTRDNITKVLYDVYDALRVHALTCGEYDALALTCEQYDSKGLSTIQYDVESKHFLIGDNLINVVTGERDSLQNILFDIMQVATGQRGLTCEEYDNLELTCEQYDNRQITTYDYDYRGNILLEV